jgi:hypothetical protein
VLGIIGSRLCTRVDLYGWSSGGPKYFAKTSFPFDFHMLPAEHFTYRVLQGRQGTDYPVCVYGD